MLKLLPLLLSAATGDIEERIRIRKQAGILYGLIGLLALSAWFALLAGIILILSVTYGAAGAAFLVAGGLIVAAFILYIVLMIRKRRQQRRLSSSPALVTAAAAATPLLLRSTSTALAAIAALAAFGIGRLAARPDRG